MVIAPVIDSTGINVFVQFFPVRVMATLGPHFFNDSRQGGVLRRQGYLNVELQIPLGITEALFAARLLLDGHQFHDVLFRYLSCRELGNITFDELASLEQLKRTVIGEFHIIVRHLLMTRLVGNHVNT